jgi:hypothetical protein
LLFILGVTRMLAVDMSNFTDPLSPAAIQGLMAAGIGHVIVQAIDPPPNYPRGRTRAQIQACLDAGLTVDAYVWLWFDLDANDIHRKLHLLDGLNVRQLWLDVEDTAAVNYSQAACEARVSDALAACDTYPTLSGARTGVYSGRWFWLDRRYMGNCTTFADRLLWDANYDDVADTRLGYVAYGGWDRPTIKQFRGSTAIAGIGGLDLNVLSVEFEAQLSPPTSPTLPDPTPPDRTPTPPDPTPPDPKRQKPDEWAWPTWEEAAINFKEIADELGQQIAERQTPEDWQWSTWREAAIQYKAIADTLGQQVAAAQPAPPAGSG